MLELHVRTWFEHGAWRHTAKAVSIITKMKCECIEFLPRSEDIRAVVVDSIHAGEVLQNE
jgi:hypothetical protein